MNIRTLLFVSSLLLPAAIAVAQPGGAPSATMQAPLPPPAPNTTPENHLPCRADRNNQAIPCQPRPYPYRRPVFIAPPPPPTSTAPPEADWDGCRQEKLRQLGALRYGDTQLANHIDEWLWKNCRSFSNELRQLEQDAM